MTRRGLLWLLACAMNACGGGEDDESTAEGADSAVAIADAAVDDVADSAMEGPLDTATTSPSDAMVDAPPEPTCPAVKACPSTPSGLTEGGGPRAIERCAFVLKQKTTSYAAVIDGLEKTLKKVSIETVAGDLNRTASAVTLSGVTGFVRGFAWDSDDNSKAWWIPQGLTGSPDAVASGTVGGKKLVIASWYYDIAKHPGSLGEKGIRISVADVTTSKVTYRHVLLVEPVMNGTRADFQPINIHAGGAAWVGRKLYVADTSRGLRVFDLDTIFETSTAKDAIGWDTATSTYQGGLYAYVLPQVGAWDDGSPCNPNFSFVAVDRKASALITGEYVSDAITGRLIRFPIDLATGALAPTTFATDAYVMGQRQVQGALTSNGAFYMSSSAPAGGGGVLYAARPGKKTISYPWVDAPEDLMFDPAANALWSLSEGEDKRWVFASNAAKIPAP